MKVRESADPGGRTESGSAAAPSTAGTGKFASVLKGKRTRPKAEAGMDSGEQLSEDGVGVRMEPARKPAGRKGSQGTAAGVAGAALLAQARAPIEPAIRANAADKAQAPAATSQIDSLVREISVAVQDRTTQVDIHLKSQTLDGLHIRISGDQSGTVAIQFLTASPQVADFLSANIDRLSASLAERDIAVSEIGVVDGGSAAREKGGAGARQRRR